jgi:RNA polymerase sigma factor (TIGR02999 family)
LQSEQSVSDNPGDITILLRRWHAGDQIASEELFKLLMPELRKIAGRCLARENRNRNRKHTYQRTELVDEGFIRLAQANNVVEWRDRGHFRAISTIKMSQILIDYARLRPKAEFLSLDDLPEGIMAGRTRKEVWLDVQRFLEEMEKKWPMTCAVVVARCVIGYEMNEIAKNLGLSLRTAERRWRNGRRWLFEKLKRKTD